MSFGKRLRELRRAKKITQKELARILKISESAVGMYERDEREPSFELTKKIADVFDVTTDYLLGRSDTIYTKDEEEFIEDIDLPIETLMEKYKLTIDGEPATKDEIENIIAFIRALRTTKKD
jgi:transcriptional regulator with XRE-family HTH domain